MHNCFKKLILVATLVLAVSTVWGQASSSSQATPKKRGLDATKASPAQKGMVKKEQVVKKTTAPDFTVEAAAVAAAQAQAKAQAAALAAAHVLANKKNVFNRTMRPLTAYNLPPAEDGIHDATLESIKALNTPLDAYTDLPRNKAGNRVDWVAAIAAKKIMPRWDRANPGVEGMVMDMDIVRIPKGSMPNVVFPHKQHTEWLACSNCHPAIFIPQKGANQMSMPLILGGQKCGVCHGKVAFPPSECSKCHSQKKVESLNEDGSS